MKNMLFAAFFGVAIGALFLALFSPIQREEELVEVEFNPEDYLPVEFHEFEPLHVIGKKPESAE